MSIADESQVPHRPPRRGDSVEVRLAGTVIGISDGELTVELDDGQVWDGLVSKPADEVAILRDVPRDEPRGFRAHRHDGLEPRLPIEHDAQ